MKLNQENIRDINFCIPCWLAELVSVYVVREPTWASTSTSEDSNAGSPRTAATPKSIDDVRRLIN